MPRATGLHYELHGPVAGEPLILSSGLGGSAGYWKPNLAALAKQYRVIVYDHRGTGRSDRALPDVVTVDQFADDMFALMDALAVPRAHIVGHAAGGVAGLALAARAPERLGRLVVVNGWTKPDPHFLRCFAARLALLRHAGPEAFLRAQPIFLYPADWISTHDAALNADLPHQLADFPGSATVERRIGALAAFDLAGLAERIDTPVCVVVAADDMLVPSQAGGKLAKALPNATQASMAWGGHACNVTDPGTFDRIVLDFLRS